MISTIEIAIKLQEMLRNISGSQKVREKDLG
jgi:hypothetical protein